MVPRYYFHPYASNDVLNASAVTCLADKDALSVVLDPDTLAAVRDLIKVLLAPNEPETVVAVNDLIKAAFAPKDPDIVVAALPSKDEMSIAPEKDPVKLAPAPVSEPASVIVGWLITGFCIFMSYKVYSFIAV